MWSSRRYSVQRHIDNVHDGISTAVSFMEYLVGRHNGVIPPPRELARTAGPKLQSQKPEKTNILDVMTAEFWKSFGKEMGGEAARRKYQGGL